MQYGTKLRQSWVCTLLGVDSKNEINIAYLSTRLSLICCSVHCTNSAHNLNHSMICMKWVHNTCTMLALLHHILPWLHCQRRIQTSANWQLIASYLWGAPAQLRYVYVYQLRIHLSWGNINHYLYYDCAQHLITDTIDWIWRHAYLHSLIVTRH